MKISKQKGKQINFEAFAVILVLGLFALSSLFLVITGASVYKNIINDTDNNSSLRASLFYVTNKIRTASTDDMVKIVKIDNLETLQIIETYPSDSDDGSFNSYITYIYYQNGGIYELYLSEKDEFVPDYGEKIVDIASFNFERKGNLLNVIVQIETEGKPYSTAIKLK